MPKKTDLRKVLEEKAKALRALHEETNSPALALKYPSIEEYVAVNGKTFTSGYLGVAEEDVFKTAARLAYKVGKVTFAPKECFYNSQLLVIHDPFQSLTYCEGFLLRPDSQTPILHAWVAVGGKIIDTTIRVNPNEKEGKFALRFQNRVLGVIPEGFQYLGIEFPDRQMLRDRIGKYGEVRSVLSDWEAQFPLLRGEMPKQAAL